MSNKDSKKITMFISEEQLNAVKTHHGISQTTECMRFILKREFNKIKQTKS